MTKSIDRNWLAQKSIAEEIIPYIGKLYRNKQVICDIYGKSTLNLSANDILQLHQPLSITDKKLDISETLNLLKLLIKLNVSKTRIDIGRLISLCNEDQLNIESYIIQQISNNDASTETDENSRDVVVYGFGRIGRLMTRILIERSVATQGLNLRAVVLRKNKNIDDLSKRAFLLRSDSVHGPLKGTIEIDEINNQLIVNGVRIQIIYAKAPEEINYSQFGITNAILIDSTGAWRNEKRTQKTSCTS